MPKLIKRSGSPLAASSNPSRVSKRRSMPDLESTSQTNSMKQIARPSRRMSMPVSIPANIYNHNRGSSTSDEIINIAERLDIHTNDHELRQVAEKYNDIGNFHFRRSEYKDAEQAYNNALKSYRLSKEGTNNTFIAATLVNIRILHLKTGLGETTEDHDWMDLDVPQDEEGDQSEKKEDVDVANALCSLGVVHHDWSVEERKRRAMKAKEDGAKKKDAYPPIVAKPTLKPHHTYLGSSFPLKLHEMLEMAHEEGLTKIVSWISHGRAFIVNNPSEFVNDIMPAYFRQTKLSSFQRQLNIYGFVRISKGKDKGAYFHDLFLRGKLSICQKMVRTKIKGTGVRMPSNPNREPDFYAMPPLSPVHDIVEHDFLRSYMRKDKKKAWLTSDLEIGNNKEDADDGKKLPGLSSDPKNSNVDKTPKDAPNDMRLPTFTTDSDNGKVSENADYGKKLSPLPSDYEIVGGSKLFEDDANSKKNSPSHSDIDAVQDEKMSEATCDEMRLPCLPPDTEIEENGKKPQNIFDYKELSVLPLDHVIAEHEKMCQGIAEQKKLSALCSDPDHQEDRSMGEDIAHRKKLASLSFDHDIGKDTHIREDVPHAKKLPGVPFDPVILEDKNMGVVDHISGNVPDEKKYPVLAFDAEILEHEKLRFPLKLHEMLEMAHEEGLTQIVSWLPHGRAFIVNNPSVFVNNIMPAYFRQTKLSSFQRQLNIYGFVRISKGKDKKGYFHELFVRGKLGLCQKMVRTKIKGTGVRMPSNPNREPDFYAMPPLSPDYDVVEHNIMHAHSLVENPIKDREEISVDKKMLGVSSVSMIPEVGKMCENFPNDKILPDFTTYSENGKVSEDADFGKKLSPLLSDLDVAGNTQLCKDDTNGKTNLPLHSYTDAMQDEHMSEVTPDDIRLPSLPFGTEAEKGGKLSHDVLDHKELPVLSLDDIIADHEEMCEENTNQMTISASCSDPDYQEDRNMGEDISQRKKLVSLSFDHVIKNNEITFEDVSLGGLSSDPKIGENHKMFHNVPHGKNLPVLSSDSQIEDDEKMCEHVFDDKKCRSSPADVHIVDNQKFREKQHILLSNALLVGNETMQDSIDNEIELSALTSDPEIVEDEKMCVKISAALPSNPENSEGVKMHQDSSVSKQLPALITDPEILTDEKMREKVSDKMELPVLSSHHDTGEQEKCEDVAHD